MEWWSWVLVFLAVVLCIVVFGRDLFLRRSLEQREDELAELDAEEHRMLDFLHHLGSSIAAEQSLQHLHRTIVEGIDEVVAADGTVLYLLENNELVPGYISNDNGCVWPLFPAKMSCWGMLLSMELLSSVGGTRNVSFLSGFQMESGIF